MRILYALLIVCGLSAALLVAHRQRQRTALRSVASEPIGAAGTAASEGAGAPAWPCTGFSAETDVEGVGARWSYRLCGRGPGDRQAEIRFRGTGGEVPVEIRAYLADPVTCEGTAYAARTLLVPQTGDVTTLVTVPFDRYGGRLWLCARRPGSDLPWRPHEARHGDAI